MRLLASGSLRLYLFVFMLFRKVEKVHFTLSELLVRPIIRREILREGIGIDTHVTAIGPGPGLSGLS